jgi:hypothetical protein
MAAAGNLLTNLHLSHLSQFLLTAIEYSLEKYIFKYFY